MTAQVERLDDIESEEPESTQDNRRPWLAWSLLSAAVVLVAAGTWLLVDAHNMRAAESARNRALVDTAVTADVSAAVSTSLNKIFSYSFDRTEVTERAAAAVLRGRALDSYNQLFARVRALAPEQRLVVTSRVVSSAVQYLDDDHAQLLVFLDQSATRAGNDSPSTAAAQLSVTAEREGDVWVITDLVPK